MCLMLESPLGIAPKEIDRFVSSVIASFDAPPRRMLIIPPDITRLHSYAGVLTAMVYQKLAAVCPCDILPALGTHMPMTRQEQIAFFGPDIPADHYLTHRWREDTAVLGVLSEQTVWELSDGLLRAEVPVEVNRALVDGRYDRILSIGQVVPHEVVGMANYTKNILVGCGGSTMISLSHLLGVLYGTERSMGCDHTPVRRLFDCAQDRFLSKLPITYLLTVTKTQDDGRTQLMGLYSGRTRMCFDRAVALSQRTNIVHVDRPIRTCVVALDPKEFRTSWVGNKSIYRTRKALAPGARLIILAPGFERFGEDEDNDRLIRKYGYIGSKAILQAMADTPDLRDNLSVVAHLAQGSCDGNFSITYCTDRRFSQSIRAVGYGWMDISQAQAKYATLQPGWNNLDGDDVYYVPNPALGLWVHDPA